MSHIKNDRREFLKFMGRTSAQMSLLAPLTGCFQNLKQPSNTPFPFRPLEPSRQDELLLSNGFNYHVLIKFNDPINSTELFGAHNDYIEFFPMDSNEHGLLWVNHEYLHPVVFHNKAFHGKNRTKNEIHKEQLSIGGSIIEIKKQNGTWSWVPQSKYNRRISALTPIPFESGFKIMGTTSAIGTIANCAGGKTPWNTVLTCEETYGMFYGDVIFKNGQRHFIEDDRLAWYKHFPFPPEHYGWVVEVNPWTGQATKRNALGRFEHECATTCFSQDGRIVVYMGEDTKGGFIYKFIGNSNKNLSQGLLYAADTLTGSWLPLDIDKNEKLKKHFSSQQEVLTYAHAAAEVVGATPQDRPEDIEIDPVTKNIIISLTNNSNRQNYYGSLLKIEETNNDHGSLTFNSQTWLAGGEQTGFACPDNLAFDNKGNLWMTVDMAEGDMGTEKFKKFGNNGLFYIPMSGTHAGRAFQVASAPVDAELTGPKFSPDYKTLFLSVQHPGSSTKDPKKPTSTWPERNNKIGKSSVVAIQGPTLEQLTS